MKRYANAQFFLLNMNQNSYLGLFMQQNTVHTIAFKMF